MCFGLVVWFLGLRGRLCLGEMDWSIRWVFCISVFDVGKV